MKSRLGKTDSIFKKTETTKDTAGKVSTIMDVRPPAGTSIENKLTVILQPEQVDFLDRLCLEIRSKTKARIKRTGIIRALIAGLMVSEMDLTGFKTEEDIASAVRKRLKD